MSEPSTPARASVPSRRDLRPSRRRSLVVATPLILGLALLGLAIPRTVAAWLTLEARPVFEKFQAGKPPTQSELAAAGAGLKRSLAWARSGRRLTDLAAVELAQGLNPEEPNRAALLASAEQHLREGLRLNPVDAFAWLRLAQVRELRGTGNRQVALALVQSLDMAPNLRLLWLPRTAMLLRYWRSLNEDEFLALRSQLRTIWDQPAYRAALIERAIDANEMGTVAAAVGDDPVSAAALARLQAQLFEASPRQLQPK